MTGEVRRRLWVSDAPLWMQHSEDIMFRIVFLGLPEGRFPHRRE